MSQESTRKGIFSEEAYLASISTLESCLKATDRRRTRDESGQIVYEDIPNWKLRKEAALAIIEQESGKATSKHQHEITPPGAGQKQLTQAQLIAEARKDPKMAARIASGYIESLKGAEGAEDQQFTDV